MDIPTLPIGTVTFLFTDIEGSTQLWERYPDQTREALIRHDQLIEETVDQNGGHIVRPRGEGDSRFGVFSRATNAVAAAAAMQQVLYAESWPTPTPLRVRIALHTGEASLREGDYYGSAVNRCARLRSAAHGGQVLISAATHELVQDDLLEGVYLRDLGEHRLKDLQRPEHIFQVVAPDLPSEFPPLKTLDNRPNNLLSQPTPFIGREKELEEVCSLLKREEVRLMTLTGPGGTGKTRLALQAAAEVLEAFQDGVWFVELAPITDPALVVPTIAQALSVREAGTSPLVETLKTYLLDKELLLVLDNFEQVIEASPLVSQLIAGCPSLKVLATSREPLRVRGEKEHAVPPFSLPDTDARHLRRHLSPLELARLTQYEAVRLFIERALNVKPDFEVTNENAPDVAEICIRLDGLPLAIELAAARVRTLPPHAMLSRLQNSLKLLTGGARDLPARQQTLRNTIEWSYDLLPEGQKQLFRRMAPFSGGRSLEASEAVCNYDGQLPEDLLDGVESLVSSSLLQQREGRDGEPRFWMLETIHEYAREKLQESEEAQAIGREHALYFMKLAEEAEPYVARAQQQDWLDRLEEEHDNLRAALEWAGESSNLADVQIGLRIASALWSFWLQNYVSEGREQAAEIIAAARRIDHLDLQEGTSAWSTAFAQALSAAGQLAWRQGDFSSSKELAEESISRAKVAGDKATVATSLSVLGWVAYDQGDYSSARSHWEEGLSIAREIGDKENIARALNSLGNIRRQQGDYAGARALTEESLAINNEIGDKGQIANSLNNLAIVISMEGDYSTARSLMEQSLALRREQRNKYGIAMALANLANVLYMGGDYSTAPPLYKEALPIMVELGDKYSIGWILAGMGATATGLGQPEEGGKLLGGAEQVLEAIGATLQPEDLIIYEAGVAATRTQLGEGQLEKARQEGREMSTEQVIEYALERPLGE